MIFLSSAYFFQNYHFKKIFYHRQNSYKIIDERESTHYLIEVRSIAVRELVYSINLYENINSYKSFCYYMQAPATILNKWLRSRNS